jgi:cytochrome bd ubiquinol oxidase subunit II
MILADAVAVAMFVGVIAYTLFAGADFGSGYYVLTAGGGVRGIEIRTLVDHSIAPVWAANNVWLIFVLLTWWTAFPTALGDDHAVNPAHAGFGGDRLAGSQFRVP